MGRDEPGSVAWTQVRDAQLRELDRLLPVICLSNLINSVVLVAVLHGSSAGWKLSGWLGTIALMVGWVLFIRRRAARSRATRANRQTVLNATVRAGFLGAMWAVPPFLVSGDASAGQQLAICLVCAGSLALAPLTFFTMPPALLTFIVVGTGGLIAMMARTGSPVLMALPLIYGITLALGGIISGRAFLRRTFAEVELAEKREVVSLLLREHDDATADWLWQTDSARQFREVSDAFARAAALSPETIEGQSIFRIIGGDDWESGASSPELGVLSARMNARDRFSGLDVPIIVAGSRRWWRLSAAPRLDEHGQFAGFRGVGRDCTDERAGAERIERLARFDALTGIPNRMHFNEVLGRAIRRTFHENTRCGLMLVDLDKFKAVNDSMGHPAGDLLLRLVAQRLSMLIGADDVCGRLGGDEFGIVVADASDANRIERLGNAIVSAMTRPFEVEGTLIHIGASIGTAIAPRDGRSLDVLLRNADLALYRAKGDGRGVHRRFDPQLLVRAERRRAIEFALREALDGGQMRLVYQPIVGTHDGWIVGFEALLRWTHPDLGEISPGEFIPIAEEIRLLGRIGEWVMRTACAEASHWPLTARVSINLAAEQLFDPHLPTTIISALSHSGLASHRLELEISEKIFLNDHAAATAALDGLRGIGVRLSLDDFGTGYSMLGYVKQNRFDTIKIDRAFVKTAATNASESVAIIKSIVAMADTLGVATIAEGAETPAESEMVRQLGCRHVQGYLAGAPMPPDEARALLSVAPARQVA